MGASGWVRGGRVAGYDVVRVVLGLVLLTAAALKGHQLATEPILAGGLLNSRWFLIGVVEFEVLFGVWLLAGPHPRLSWLVALGCFGFFAAVSAWKGLSGATSCGCFGRVPVNPWYTFALDTLAVVLLSAARPAHRGCQVGKRIVGASPLLSRNRPDVFSVLPTRVRRFPIALVGCLWVALGLPGAVMMASFEESSLNDAGQVIGNGNIVILEPETWVGKRFPLLAYIDIGDELGKGEWIVALWHHACPRCQHTIPAFERLTSASGKDASGLRAALVELPPYGAEPAKPGIGAQARGRLCNAKQWFVTVPVFIKLEDAVVISTEVFAGLDTVASNPSHPRSAIGRSCVAFSWSLENR